MRNNILYYLLFIISCGFPRHWFQTTIAYRKQKTNVPSESYNPYHIGI